MLCSVDHLRLPFDVESWTSAAVILEPTEARAECAAVQGIENHRLILLLHLPQLFIPKRFALDTLHRKLPAQRRSRIAAPDHLADCLIAPALHHHQVANVDLARAQQTSAARMDIVRTRHLCGPAP